MTAFNINQTVRVKLTPFGRKCHRANHDSLVKSTGATGLDYRPPVEDADGWSEWQLWCLMSEFGGHMYQGGELPFETNILLP